MPSHFFMFLLWIIEENAPGGGVLARFYMPEGWQFWTLFCQGVGNSPIKKLAGVLPRGMVRLGIDWYVRSVLKNISRREVTSDLILLMYTVASSDPDPNSRGGGQLPNPKSVILR